MRTFSVKNFEKFQHYKDRAPPWIKLYNELLDDYAFGRLRDASKMHLIAIWLLASRYDNKIPYDAEWISKRINATEPVNLGDLAQAGFIIVDQDGTELVQDAINTLAISLPRDREETEGEKEKKKDYSTVAKATRRADEFDEFWKAYPKRRGANPKAPAEKLFWSAVKAGADPKDIAEGARRCAVAEAAKVATEFIPQAVKWLRDKRWQDYLETQQEEQITIDWDKQLTQYKRGYPWSAKWYGPEPGQLGCRVPIELLEKHGLVADELAQ